MLKHAALTLSILIYYSIILPSGPHSALRHAALTDMPRVLAWLEKVSASEAASKFDALRAVRPAFVFTSDASVEKPAAGEFVLSEACRRAKRMPLPRAGVTAEETAAAVAGGRHAGCTLH